MKTWDGNENVYQSVSYVNGVRSVRVAMKYTGSKKKKKGG